MKASIEKRISTLETLKPKGWKPITRIERVIIAPDGRQVGMAVRKINQPLGRPELTQESHE